MGRDHQPKARQLARRERKAELRAGYDRILIVSEGRKTEPQYFEEIRSAYRLNSANVQVYPSQMGTAPLQVVQYAMKLFKEGDHHSGIRPQSFDQVYVVFDRDAHDTYYDALTLTSKLSNTLRNDYNHRITF